jgi:FAD synthase
MKDWTYALPEDPRVAARRLAKIEAALSEERQRQIRREIAVKAIRAINEAEKGTSLEELIRDLENDTSALREGGKIIGN